jgi:hypothetical protein
MAQLQPLGPDVERLPIERALRKGARLPEHLQAEGFRILGFWASGVFCRWRWRGGSV